MRRFRDTLWPGRRAGFLPGLVAGMVVAAPPQSGRAESGCAPGIERFGERLLAVDERRVLVGSPFAFGGAGWCGLVDMADCTVIQEWWGASGSALGWALALADLDGDGLQDLVLGAPGSVLGTVPGQVAVHRGTAAGFEAVPSTTIREGSPGERFGEALAVLDPDADGDPDLAVGAGTFSGGFTYEGVVRLYGNVAGALQAEPRWTLSGRALAAGFGRALSAGDLDDDGYDDLVVGSPEGSWGEAREGRAEVFRGSSEGLAADAAWTATGDEDYAYFGYAVAVLPRESDGSTAVWAVGAPGAAFDRGSVQLFAGGGFSRRPFAVERGATASAWFGAVLVPTVAGGDVGLGVGAAGDAGGDGSVSLLTPDPCRTGAARHLAARGARRSRLGSALAASGRFLWMGAPWEDASGGPGAVRTWIAPLIAAPGGLAHCFTTRDPELRAEIPPWNLRVTPAPVGPDSWIQVIGAAGCGFRWECLSADGRLLAAGRLEGPALAWRDLQGRASAPWPRTGWLRVSDGRASRVLRWVDLGGADP